MTRFKIKNRFKITIVFVALIVVLSIGAGIGYALFFGGTSVNLQKGLVGYWKFDGNAKDSTPNSNHGTVTGASLTTDRKGQSNKAYNFNGTTDVITVTDSTSLDVATEVTIGGWVYDPPLPRQSPPEADGGGRNSQFPISNFQSNSNVQIPKFFKDGLAKLKSLFSSSPPKLQRPYATKEAQDKFHQELARQPIGTKKIISPYQEVTNLGNGQFSAEVSILPLTKADLTPIDPVWRKDFFGNWVAGENLFASEVSGNKVHIAVGNDQPLATPKPAGEGGPVQIKQGDDVTFAPQLFVGGKEYQAKTGPLVLAVDPLNENYKNNTLEWDYGVAKRRLRIIEGNIQGSWVFSENPMAEVRIKYNQQGKLALNLGGSSSVGEGTLLKVAVVNNDEEVVPASQFAQAKSFPVSIADSATYNPDADPETTSVDGSAKRETAADTWAAIRDGAGTHAADDGTTFWAFQLGGGSSSDTWRLIERGIILFDTSGLPDGAVVSAATLSIYGQSKLDNLSATPDVNIYTSTPASNTAVVAGDFTQTGIAPQSSAIAYADFSTTGYNDFALNDMTKISLTGVSKFATRNANYDVANTAPTWSWATSRMGAYTSEQGDGYKPKLVVTYTVPLSPSIIDKGIDAYGIGIDGSLNVTGYISGSASSTTQITKAWHHVVMTYDGSNIKLYVDGVLKVTTAKTGAIATNSTSLTMGNGMAGKLDDMRVYNRALSSVEISAWYEAYNPSVVISDLQKGLVGQWKMDGNAKDATPYSNHGTVTGAALTTDRKGQTNKAYNFNGTTDVITVTDSTSLDIATEVTIGGWVYDPPLPRQSPPEADGGGRNSQFPISVPSGHLPQGDNFQSNPNDQNPKSAGSLASLSEQIEEPVDQRESAIISGNQRSLLEPFKPFFTAIQSAFNFNPHKTLQRPYATAQAQQKFHQELAQQPIGTKKIISPYQEVTNLGNGKFSAEVSILPLTKADLTPIDPVWRKDFFGNWVAGENLFASEVSGNKVHIAVGNDQPLATPKPAGEGGPVQIKQGDDVTYAPQLFVGGKEYHAKTGPAVLAVDPLNENYKNNTLEWDYGVAKRRLRIIEGHISGSWVFAKDPLAEVRIKYNQQGKLALNLGGSSSVGEGTLLKVAVVDNDEEVVPASQFATADLKYPVSIADSATYNPDADPETTSVDGWVSQEYGAGSGQSWATIIAAAGVGATDSAVSNRVFLIRGDGSAGVYRQVDRSIFLFDSSALPDTAVKSAAVVSLYGMDKGDIPGIAPNINIYTSTPASNVALEAGDYAQIQAIAKSTAIAYADWSTTGYNDFTLNDLTIVSLTGVTKLAARNANYDVAASDPGSGASTALSYLSTYMSEQGTGYKPKLVVTYSFPTIIGKGRDAYALEIDGSLNVTGYISSSASSSTQITKAWHHVVMTYDGANIKLYVDGVLKVTTAKTGAIATNSTSLTMGNGMAGKLDDMRVYNRALSSAEISAWYEAYNPSVQISDLQKGLVGNWKMDGNAKDSTPNSNHGTVTGAALTTDRKGQTNKAYNFNGTTDVITVTDSTSLDIATEVTIGGWVYDPPLPRQSPPEADGGGRNSQFPISNFQSNSNDQISKPPPLNESADISFEPLLTAFEPFTNIVKPLFNFDAPKKLQRPYATAEAQEKFHQELAKQPIGTKKIISPYQEVTNLGNGQFSAEVSILPLTKADLTPIDPVWRKDFFGNWVAGENLFASEVKGNKVHIAVGNDQPFATPKPAGEGGPVQIKAGDDVTFAPQLFVGGKEYHAKTGPAVLAVDPLNENYKNNTLEWDYGVAKRRLRIIEGHISGSWVFAKDPLAEVRIKYNQSGKLALNLGGSSSVGEGTLLKVAVVNNDEEVVPASQFAQAKSFPVSIADSATYNPDADPETTSVDGDLTWSTCSNCGVVWSTMIVQDGTGASSDLGNLRIVTIIADTTGQTDKWRTLRRGIMLFDTSGLPDDATITAATLSLYGYDKTDSLGITPDVNIYSSAPASNTALVGGDFDSLGSTAFSTAITYASLSTTGYNDFVLNSNGITAINLTGVSKFGGKNANYDAANVAPAWTADTTSSITVFQAEQGAGYKPKLVVTYTLPLSPSIIDKGTDAYGIGIDGSLNVTGYVSGSASSTTQITKAWHHVVMTYDGANIKLYVDGVLKVTTAKTGAIATNSTSLTMGNGMAGKLDDMRVYNRALSATEVLALYESYR